MQEASGCMSEIGARIGFRSFTLVKKARPTCLLRAAQNRRVEPGEEELAYSLDRARSWPSQASRPLEVPARHGQKARSTQVQLAFGQMTLLPPRHDPRQSKEPLTVWVVRVWEEQKPEGAEPLEWLLLTSVSTTTLDQAWERVDWYRQRWLVEDYRKSPQKRLSH